MSAQGSEQVNDCKWWDGEKCVYTGPINENDPQCPGTDDCFVYEAKE